MKDSAQGTLTILAGPSGVGKTPLKNAFAAFYPDTYAKMNSLVLFSSRAPRPGETEGSEYFFRSPEYLKKLRHDPKFKVIKVHNDYQAIDITHLSALLKKNDVFFEGNSVLGRLFQTTPDLKDFKTVSVFLSPLTGQEIVKLRVHGKRYFRETFQKIIKHKLLDRLKKSGFRLDSHQMKDIERRTADAYHELKEAHYFDFIIPNHDGEDSDNWKGSLLPTGDAGRALDAFASILAGKSHPIVEKWEENLVP